MTPAQKKALRRHRKKLQQAFTEAAAAATTPGKARTWYVPYLAAVLNVYRELATKSVDGKALSKAVAKDPRIAFFRLLTSSKRDSKTRRRWAAALAHAYEIRHFARTIGKMAEKGQRSCGSCSGAGERNPHPKASSKPTATPNQQCLTASAVA